MRHLALVLWARRPDRDLEHGDVITPTQAQKGAVYEGRRVPNSDQP